MPIHHVHRRIPITAMRRIGKRSYVVNIAGGRYRLNVTLDDFVRLVPVQTTH